MKTMSALKWATVYCANAKFFLKGDDDVIYNVQNIISKLKRVAVSSVIMTIEKSVICNA